MFHATSGRSGFNPLKYDENGTLAIEVNFMGSKRFLQVDQTTTWLGLIEKLTAMPRMAPASMSIDAVCNFLVENGLGTYSDAFRKEGVDGEILMDLDQEGCRELGVKS